MNLFQLGNFTLRSGQKSSWKIDCDALTPDDWAALAKMTSEILPPFSSVYGVPRGGIPFEELLRQYVTGNPNHPVLIAEDVVTTGGSMERFVEQLRVERFDGDFKYVGVAVFARGHYPNWIKPLFCMPGAWPITTGDGE